MAQKLTKKWAMHLLMKRICWRSLESNYPIALKVISSGICRCLSYLWTWIIGVPSEFDHSRVGKKVNYKPFGKDFSLHSLLSSLLPIYRIFFMRHDWSRILFMMVVSVGNRRNESKIYAHAWMENCITSANIKRFPEWSFYVYCALRSSIPHSVMQVL